jgi:hypothetical protein
VNVAGVVEVNGKGWGIPVVGGRRESAVDQVMVERFLELLMAPGTSHVVQAAPSWRARRIDRDDMLSALLVVQGLADHDKVYVTASPVDKSHPAEKAANNGHILRRTTFVLDLDHAGHAIDQMATEAEREPVMEAAAAAVDLTTAAGWPSPVVVDSGNGCQLLWRVDLPTDKLTQKTLAQCLKVLASKLDTEGAKVDTATHAAKQLIKLPGTMVRKGPNTPDRPHRMSRIVYAPRTLEVVGWELIQALAGPEKPPPGGVTPDHAADAGKKVDAPSGSWGLKVQNSHTLAHYVEQTIQAEEARVALALEGTRNAALNEAAFRVGTMADWPEMLGGDARERLYRAALSVGLGELESRKTIESGWTSGKAKGRERPQPKPSANGKAKSNGKPQETEKPVYEGPLTIRGSEVVPQDVRWLWKPRIPQGFITLLAGKSGVGKSFVMCDLAARLSRGDDMPDSFVRSGEVTRTLFISEDPVDYMLAPRLIEMGADMREISFLRWEAMASWSLADASLLTRAWEEAGQPGLVVVDPPTSFLRGNIDEHKNSEVRQVLMGLVGWLMERPTVALIFITHVNKAGKGVDALDRVIGSVAWTTTCRAFHIIAEDPDTPRSLFIFRKTNVGPLAPALPFRLEVKGEQATLKWEPALEGVDASEVLSGTKKQPRGVVAVDWLADRFREKTWWASDDLKEAASQAGLSRNALFSAEVKKLPIQRKQVVAEDNGQRYWSWQLIPGRGWPPEE